MKKSSMRSSLNKVTGLTEAQIMDQQTINDSALLNNNSGNRRSIVIEKNRLQGGVGMEKSFEIVTKKIAKVITNRREEVENALIVTGSPISVRKYNRKKLNAAVQNRLVDTSKDGIAFRQYMTFLVGETYGNALLMAFFEQNQNQKTKLMLMVLTIRGLLIAGKAI